MTVLSVSSQSQFLAAVASAKGGDTILLADGNYGAVTLTQKFGSTVTIAAVNAQGAHFDSLTVKGGANMTFSGLSAGSEFRAWSGASNIALSEVETKSFYFRDVAGLRIDHSEADGGYNALTLNNVSKFAITNSAFRNAVEDVSRVTGNSYDGLFENNIFSDTRASRPMHPDLMQMFNVGAHTPHDITIRGNLFYDDPKTGSVIAQGIFLGDPGSAGFRNILIEDNAIAVRSPNSIYINGGQENVILRNNTLMGYDESNGGVIRLASKSGYDNAGVVVEGNVAKVILNETGGSKILENHIYGKTSAGLVFEGTTGANWGDFALRDDDLAQSYGSQITRPALNETAASQPVATPDPIEKVYGFDGARMFTGNMDGRVIRKAHDATLEIDEGTIAFDFNADTVGWRRGLVSKDAAGTGDHFAAWIDNGTLMFKFGSGNTEQSLSIKGIVARKDYDVVASFDEHGAKVWLDGKLVGTLDGHMDWSDNDQTLMIGADNSASASGTTSAARYIYDGTLSDLAIYDHAMTPTELAAHVSGLSLG